MSTLQDKKSFNITFYLLILPVLLWLIVLIVLPHIDLFISSFQVDGDNGKVFSFDNYAVFFQNKIYWFTFINTVAYAIGITLLAFVVTFPVAFYLTKVVSKKYASFLSLLLLIPLWIGELVTIYGWMIILGDHGIINEGLIYMGIIDKPLHMLYTNL